MDYIALQAPLSMGFPRQEYWSRLPFPSPGDLPDPRIEPLSPAVVGGFFTTEPPGCAMVPPLRRDWHSGEPGKGVGRGWPLSWVLGMIIDLFTGKGRESISGKGKLLIMSQRWEWAQRMAEIGGQLWGAICNFKLINLYRSPQCSEQCMQGG